MTMIPNQVEFEKALKTLTENDRKTLEAFAHFLLVSSSSSLADKYSEKLTPEHGPGTISPYGSAMKLDPNTKTDVETLVQKANKALLKDYVELKVQRICYADDLAVLSSEPTNINFFFENREKPVSFPDYWLLHSRNGGDLTGNIKSLFVKFRPGTNRIDKVAFDAKFLTDAGKTESKKRILVLNSNNVPVSVAGPELLRFVPADPELLKFVRTKTITPEPVQTATQFVQSLINTKLTDTTTDGWNNTSAIAQISVPKNHVAFSKVVSFKEGRLRLSRVGEILFNMLDQAYSKKYVWDSEFFFGSPHDFTDIKTGKTYDVKCHFHPSERLQLSQNTLNKCDSDYIVAVMVQEDSVSFTATVTGYISREDFTNKTKPWAYNEYVDLRSLDLHELNSPKDLF
jgi:hypothetical protein